MQRRMIHPKCNDFETRNPCNSALLDATHIFKLRRKYNFAFHYVYTVDFIEMENCSFKGLAKPEMVLSLNLHFAGDYSAAHTG